MLHKPQLAAGCQTNPIDVNFHLQTLEIQLTKSDPKRIEGGKCPPLCQLGLTHSQENYTDNFHFKDTFSKYSDL